MPRTFQRATQTINSLEQLKLWEFGVVTDEHIKRHYRCLCNLSPVLFLGDSLQRQMADS